MISLDRNSVVVVDAAHAMEAMRVALRESTVAYSLLNEAYISVEFDASHSAMLRKLWKGSRLETLRHQARMKGRPGWRRIPHELKIPGMPKVKLMFSPAGSA